MDTNKYLVFFITKRSFWIISCCIIVLIASLSFANPRLGLICTFFVTAFLIFYFKTRNNVRADFENYMESISLDMESASKGMMLMLAIPIVLIDHGGHIYWKNSFFTKLFKDDGIEKDCIECILEKTLAGRTNLEIKEDIHEEILFDNRHYSVYGRELQKFHGKEKQVMLLYLLDDTEHFELNNKYNSQRAVVGIVIIDNYDDLMQSLSDSKRPQLVAEVDAKIVEWGSFTGGIIKKFERDKYIMFFQRQFLKDFEEKRFDILETIKEINIGNKIPVTLSIGLDNTGETFASSFQFALASLEIALGRGGDQVVVRNGDNIQFFGGKTREIEKRTRVKARVIAQALRELIKHCSQVIIMGHANCDVDSLGSSVGVYKIADSVNKKAHIVLSATNPTIEAFMQDISKAEEYEGVFINKQDAIDLITKNTLLVVVDTHRPAYTECPELLKHSENIVVIDHHRRGAEFIQDAVLTYQEPYASSTCELVTEIIQYIEDTIKIGEVEAELLYSGIVVDTKGFTFKTGVRTFEAAAYLRKKGVDTIHVKQLLQNDLESYINIANIVKEVEILSHNIAISVCPPNVKKSSLIAAQAADQILSIAGIGAAFVISDSGNGIIISGRSFGDVNVQVILEKIGGGGHQTVAGAQFYNEKLEDVVAKLKQAIADYIKEVSKDW